MIQCERCETITTDFYSTANEETYCLPCVGFIEAMEATEEGRRIRWQYRINEPKADSKPTNPSKMGFVQIQQYAKQQQKRLERPDLGMIENFKN